MSLTEVKLSEVVKKQFLYKLKAFSGVLSSLMITQVIAILFSFAGSTGTSHMDYFTYSVAYYTSDVIIFFTFLWAFITAILITTKAYRDDDFSFVSNRLSSNLSNICFIVSVSVVSGITALLSGFLVKVIVFYTQDVNAIVGSEVTITALVAGIIATIFYILLFSSLGYFIGMLVQISKLFAVVIPALFFGYLFLGATGPNDNPTLITKTIAFFNQETSISMFVIKALLTAAILLAGSVLVSNRLEVKR